MRKPKSKRPPTPGPKPAGGAGSPAGGPAGRPTVGGGGARGAAAREKWIRLRVEAELLEDAHPGSGSGGGGIDALIARDRKGCPVIWASHLEGLLRDAAREVYEDREAQVSLLFGARGGVRQGALFTSLYSEAPGETRVWRSTARASFDNRAPAADTLRALEFVPKGTRFHGFIELRDDPDRHKLERLFRHVQAIGNGRSSGAGRVTFTVQEAGVQARNVDPSSECLRLLLRNLDPLCVSATAIPGNLIPSLPFMPGRTLLGALADWLHRAGESAAASLVVSGAISVGDALPLGGPVGETSLSAIEALPAPLALQSTKPSAQAGDMPWWSMPSSPPERVNVDARANASADGSKDGEGEKLKRPEPDLFVSRVAAGQWNAYRPDIRVRLRNGRNDPRQLDSDLFAVEQIAEHTWFLAELRAKSEAMAALRQGLLPLLNGSRWLRVGRGGAPVEVAGLEWLSPAPQRRRGTGLPASGAPPTVGAYLTLTSDLLARDEWLRWLTAWPESPDLIAGWPRGVKAEPVRQDETSIHGFNGTARLWRLPAAGIRRGSVFRVGGEAAGLLREAAAAGRWLGERTHEGFGRFRVDERLPGETGSVPAVLAPGATVDEPRPEQVARVTREWLRSSPQLAEPPGSGERRPSLSQWQDLVSALRAKDPVALSSRLNPATAGALAWKDERAAEILRRFQPMSEQDRIDYAETFVRWLRARMREKR